MEENKNLQPEPEISPEERLDQLLAEFLAIPDMELPSPVEVSPQPEPDPLPAQEICAPAEEASLPSSEAEDSASEEEVDILPALAMDADADILSAFLSDPAPEAQPEPEPESQAEPEIPQEPAEGQIVPLEDVTIGESLDVPQETEAIGVDEQALEAAGLTTVEPQELDTDSASQEEPTASIPVLISTNQNSENTDTKEPDPMAQNIPAEEELPLAEEEYTPPKKIRPKKKGRYGFLSIPHLAAVAIWLAIIVFVGASLGNILWEYAADMLAFGRESKSVTITITEGDDLDAVCSKLQSTGLIKYPGLFSLYAGLSDAMEDIRPGTYTLNTVYDYMALVDAMSGNAARVTTKVVIPEGYTCQQIFKLLESRGVCSAEKLEEAAANADLDEYWFLEGVDRSVENCLEGYLFPDTYQFYLNHDPSEVLQKFLDNFNKRFNETMKANLVTLNDTLSEMMRKNGMSEDYIAQHQMTIREVVIIASMIEKETASTAEGYTVASVIYNRLTNPGGETAGFLQIDATLVYYTGHNELTAEDLAADHPYNTYKRPGLIPGPISNPSRASLDAALDPNATTYYYYALNPATGTHKFSETLAEHEAFLESLRQNNEETP